MEQEQLTIVVALIRNEKGEILVAQRNDPESLLTHNKWEFVGGGINFSETPEQAVVREVREETGLEVKVKKLLPKIFSHTWNLRGKDTQILILSYECQIISGKPTLGIDEEIKDLKFIKPQDIENYECLPNVKEIANLLIN